jgi:hypothetical protein
MLRPVPHGQYVFTVLRLIRPFFAQRRSLLEELCRIIARSLIQAYGVAHSARPPRLYLFVPFGDLVNAYRLLDERRLARLLESSCGGDLRLGLGVRMSVRGRASTS